MEAPDDLVKVLEKAVQDRDKAQREINELKRTRAEAEAAARIEGYKEGQRDLRRDIRAMLLGPVL